MFVAQNVDHVGFTDRNMDQRLDQGKYVYRELNLQRGSQQKVKALQCIR